MTSFSKNQKPKTPKLRLKVKLTRIKYLVKDFPFTDKIIDGLFIPKTFHRQDHRWFFYPLQPASCLIQDLNKIKEEKVYRS